MSQFGIEDADNIDPFTCSDWGVGIAKNTPSKLWRSILQSRAITYAYLDYRANLWSKTVTDNDKQQSSTKSNVIRALKSPRMSWTTFMRGVRILGLDEVTFFAEVTWPDQVITRHRHHVQGTGSGGTPEQFKHELKSMYDEVEDLFDQIEDY